MKFIANLMIKRLALFGIFITIFLTIGCTLQDPTSNPSYSVLPKLLLDYDFDVGETSIWVKSAVGDFKYDNVTIEISSNEQRRRIMNNNTYFLFASTVMSEFNLDVTVNATVNSEEKRFIFNCEVNVDIVREDLIIITTYDEKTDEELEEKIHQDDLPYKKILEEFKEE